ncbi:HAMP domain-containing sensor histidine kinase [Colwellia sp. 4_MG-2023]|uniref:sensor histidine kinase n=1 Tax=unclassified Colwellia TaxID=196834 RepID=UPI001C0836C9|nr:MULTISPECIES: HAMP domain-containing sensor histidine kinase [unclassified Colwellia]MBU2924885.1 HAMP domain-containing histidine kinase [Colwellia sp. C2M11]MDO6487654.1 HAMP domain-containing sensor histidine kinase [Colwellia sp. 6_MG-2023]MDO6506784.1 HAMP domain-containing sensor histidine kinase [Colwellia sp. 5_MG-2023]MDO6555841.1 HAMP domain-containing sensor histidine kinase [Colwellia sp. 4_MG-2023]MDO6652885.1 HAMP domain-containing sensor histidine kinase [Colwellia sp. 3_MG-2
MKSIKQSLVKQLTTLITFILFIVLLFLDISVDTYVDKQFDDALEQKGKSLVNLISYKENSLQLTMLIDVMTEFSRTEHAEYFQIWSNDKILKYSPTLNQTPEFDFNRVALSLGGHMITQADLPNGESGRVFLFKFIPTNDNDATDIQSPIYLVFARSSATLEQILILIDIVFLITAIGTAFFVRYLVNKIVSKGVEPITLLNKQIREIDINNESEKFFIDHPPSEIKTIIDELNQFLIENRALLKNEKRLTSDIAHELKTPITELMSVSEIAIKYPENEEVIENYKDDVLSISTRMKNIVESLLLLNKVSTEQFNLTMVDIDLSDKVFCILERLAITIPNFEQRISTKLTNNIVITNDVFSLEAILTNLINNAIHYSPEASIVTIELNIINDKPKLTISNIPLQQLTAADINNMFEPLWQKDNARTSETHFGLGLAIVKTLAERANIKISVELKGADLITFGVVFDY